MRQRQTLHSGGFASKLWGCMQDMQTNPYTLSRPLKILFLKA